MRKSSSRYRYVEGPPTRRPLKIFAFDPMLGRVAGNKVSVSVPYEPLEVGPEGSKLQVVDYDGANGRFYEPVDLEHPSILIQGGLDPTESDPRFHQQMVYAVAMTVFENFERSLGRKLRLRRDRRLKVFPHAFYGPNAFYQRDTFALLFGYFRADEEDPGPNLPGQTVFTCLSHDIIAHETTHAIVDRLRKHFIDPSNEDVYAFHEGFADIVAIFQHFSLQEVLREHIQATRTDLRVPTPLVDLAREFGFSTGRGEALRSAVEDGAKPDPLLYQRVMEPHERGSILVAAVFDAFFTSYQARIRDLIRIATGGSGVLPAGDLHPDLVNRVAAEAARTAYRVLTMCIRAFEYLPPVDVTFGDFLRALVTADHDLFPEDGAGHRAAMVEGFRVRGVYPRNVQSLAEESLLWEDRGGDRLPRLPVVQTGDRLVSAARAFERRPTDDDKADEARLQRKWAPALHEYAVENAAALDLDPGRPIEVLGFHSTFRVGSDGQLNVEVVAQLAQQAADLEEKLGADLGGVPVRGGTTVVASADGQVRYVISKPLPSPAISGEKQEEADERVERQVGFVEAMDREDPFLAWADERYLSRRLPARLNFMSVDAAVH